MKHYSDKHLKGYEVIVDDSGKLAYVDAETGELVSAMQVYLPVGSIAYTPQSQRAYQRRKEATQAKEDKEFRKKYTRKLNEELGHYYFAESRDFRSELSPQSVTRLMFLATFLRYNSNILYATERKILKKSQLSELLHLSEKTFYRFWTEVSGKYVIENPDGTLSMGDIFFRGNMSKKFENGKLSASYQKIYISALRELYDRTPISKHRYLGYVFSILPFINWEYNILSHNPEENDLDKLKTMTLDDLCEALHYSKSQRSRLLDAYKQLLFECEGKQQHFLSFVTDDPRTGDFRIFVNPHVLYRGSDWKRVEILGAFF